MNAHLTVEILLVYFLLHCRFFLVQIDAERAEYRHACQYVGIVLNAAIIRIMILTCFCRKLAVPVIVVIRP